MVVVPAVGLGISPCWRVTQWHKGFPHSGIQRKVMVRAAGVPAVRILFLCGAEHTLTDNAATAVDIRQALICILVFCGRKKGLSSDIPCGLWIHPAKCLWEILLNRQRVQKHKPDLNLGLVRLHSVLACGIINFWIHN